MVNLLTVATSSKTAMSREQLDATFDTLFGKTSGTLVKIAATEQALNEDDLSLCRTAVRERNRLIHHFFRQHAENFMTSTGQQRMVDDLADISRLFEAADAACKRVMFRIGEACGLTTTAVAREYAEIIDRIR
ncbi:hypothetical protein [Nocardia abscessus]|uniref:hypothetical protein n=1 Tax=Nocardia abscessus TaxID=120957 RepID=UPI0024552FA7|nr:hypothetical protein [Nocardia abscessus]